MNLNDRLQNVAVLGAGGKMGSGISFLMAREMILQQMKTNLPHQLVLMDAHPDALKGLRQYLESQAKKYALKNAETLKDVYGPVPDDNALADQYAADLLSICTFTTALQEAGEALMIFEAIIEQIDTKVMVLNKLRASAVEPAFFFTNTSSIPIKELNDAAKLDGRIIGFHFYNPPVIQKLVELILPDNVHPDLPDLARDLGNRLGKKLIPSRDVAGFIGNGHFIRDGLYALSEVQRLREEFSHVQSVYAVNQITQDFLLRPMGIFQLIDYVGIDVFQSILNTMDPHFPEEELRDEIIDRMVHLGVKGGQYPDGSQKDGFLKYEKNRPVGVYDILNKNYVLFTEGSWKAEIDREIQQVPGPEISWKTLLKDPEKDARLRNHFNLLKKSDTFGADLAIKYLTRSKEIGQMLVDTGVAHSAEDVNGVLMYGFYHLYGPVNDYV